MNRVLQLVIQHGARLAEPGEFTKRAYLNNKIDLAQAEGVADLIAAQTQEAALAAHASLTGGFSSNINSCIDALVASRAYIEASLDFPEEDLEQKDLDRIEVEIKEQLDFIQSTIASSKKGVLAREGFCWRRV